jgi:hypothetical protein
MGHLPLSMHLKIVRKTTKSTKNICFNNQITKLKRIRLSTALKNYFEYFWVIRSSMVNGGFGFVTTALNHRLRNNSVKSGNLWTSVVLTNKMYSESRIKWIKRLHG